MMEWDRRAHHTECEIHNCKDRKQKSAYDLKCHMERQHNCSEEIIKARFNYKNVEDDKISDKYNVLILKNLLDALRAFITLLEEDDEKYNDLILKNLSIIIGQGYINELQYCLEKEKIG